MSEFFDYINDLVWQVESGRIAARDVRSRLIQDWGGSTVRGYIPKRDPQERAQISRMVESGLPERSARRMVRGK